MLIAAAVIWPIAAVLLVKMTQRREKEVKKDKHFSFWVVGESCFYALQQRPSDPNVPDAELVADRTDISFHFEAGARAAAKRFGIEVDE